MEVAVMGDFFDSAPGGQGARAGVKCFLLAMRCHLLRQSKQGRSRGSLHPCGGAAGLNVLAGCYRGYQTAFRSENTPIFIYIYIDIYLYLYRYTVYTLSAFDSSTIELSD